MSEPIEDSLPRLLGGRYRLEAKLGHGGMGVVYRATDLTMKRQVAVKLIRGAEGAPLDDEIAGRFLREAKNTARIQHEHIIEVYDLGRSNEGDLFFVMELLEGESLSARIRREGRIQPKVAVHIGSQICAALHVAHAAGVIHRDLKPANVMLVSRAGDNAYVKVLDFGVAKSYSADQQTTLTHTGMLVGTVEYMAPEQIMGKQVDGRTDVYALGITLYRMLAGKAPFKDGGVPALIHAHLNLTPKPLVEKFQDVPPELDRIVQRCLAKRPDQRYASMPELANALLASVQAQNLVDLEYDPYSGAGDKTEVGPSKRREEAFDDATIKMDRSIRDLVDAHSQPKAASVPPVPPPALRHIDATAVMRQGQDESTAKRKIPDEITRVDRSSPSTCAMCQTVNAPHVRACVACGVSLAADDQAAVRARVQAPRPAHAPAPAPPPISGAYHQVPLVNPYVPSPGHGVPQVAWGQQQPPMHAPPRPPSMWERFLRWTGLGSR
jgi:serine/threonine-protein kinase